MQKRKLFYVPGLISLVGLPIILLLLGPEEEVKPNVLRMFMPLDEPQENVDYQFTRPRFYEDIKGKNIIAIHGQSSLVDEFDSFRYNRRMKFISHELERLQFTHDTNSILKIEFDESNAYGDFVHILNMAILYDIKRYAYVDSSIFLFTEAHPSHEKRYVEDIYVQDIEYELGLPLGEAPPTRLEEFRYWLDEELQVAAYMAKGNYLLIAAFLILIIIPSTIRLIRSRRSDLAG